jgi:hypothetical protein
VKPAPLEDDSFIPEVTPPLRTSWIDTPSDPARVQSDSRALLVAMLVIVSLAAGFGGGFIVGQRSKPAESTNVSHHEPVAAPQPTRVAAEDPKPVASTTQTVAPISKEAAPIPKQVTPVSKETAPVSKEAAPAPKEKASVPALESGRLLIRSTPAGASVVVDGQSRGVTPLALREIAFGAHRVEVSHPGQPARWLWVTLTERRPSQTVDFDFRPTSEPAHDTPDTNTTGSLHVASRPSGAQVFVDDNLIGTTPLLLSNVAAGSRRLRIELSGYKSWTGSVQIEPGARRPVSASLEP